MIAQVLSNVIDMFASPNEASDRGWSDVTSGSTIRTGSGEAVNEQSAEKNSAVWCATRVLADGVASLPLNLREHVDDRNTRTATEHPYYRLMHDAPNSELNIYSFFDMQVPFQTNWGNSYAELQRDITGRIEALWPIHPSRIPRQNIVRGPFVHDGQTFGQNGEAVYLVRNNGGTVMPIPASDMLHVPGVASGDGLTGKGLVRVAAESLGIIKATETHVGSFFKNGATPDIVVTIPSSVKPEERQNLRESWKSMHTGAKNAHNMLLLVGESKAEPLGINPNDAQLLDSRRFGIEEVSRFWRVPKHFLSSLEGANYNSLELLNSSFLIYSLLPWMLRWEKALNHQLLTPEEQKRYFFKFNINGLLRGDSAARSQFYMRMFDMGCLSINEIRELEDLNPIDGGDRYFILANNRVPLDRIDDAATLNKPASQPAANDGATGTALAPARVDEATAVESSDELMTDESASTTEDFAELARETLQDAIDGMVCYERQKMRRAAETPREFAEKCQAFYAEGKFPEMFRQKVSRTLTRSVRFGVTTTAAELTQQHIDRSVTELLAMESKPFGEFTRAVNVLLDSWSDRAAEEAAGVFSIQGAN